LTKWVIVSDCSTGEGACKETLQKSDENGAIANIRQKRKRLAFIVLEQKNNTQQLPKFWQIYINCIKKHNLNNFSSTEIKVKSCFNACLVPFLFSMDIGEKNITS
jgi:hypothetical protein